MYIYTSGTTGMPKAAVIKHARYILASRGLTSIIGVKKSDILYCPLPLYHSVGGMISLSGQVIIFFRSFNRNVPVSDECHSLFIFLGCMSSGISMVLRDKFSASQYFQDCARYRVSDKKNLFFSPPSRKSYPGNNLKYHKFYENKVSPKFFSFKMII